jgi:hypothetical protein
MIDMFWMLSVCTFLTLTVLPTRNSWIKALAVLFLALTALTAAPLPSRLLTRCRLRLYSNNWLCLGDGVYVMVVVGATVAGALSATHFPWGKAFAIHLEAFSLFAGASRFLLLDHWSWCNCFVLGVLHLVNYWLLRIFLIFLFFGNIIV